MSKINQKEYLKKYLSGEKKKRKKKKSSTNDKTRVKIIDDDVDVTKNRVDYDDELILTGEDAPQIVGIIDDRPPEIKALEDLQNSGKWKSVPELGRDKEKDQKIKEKLSSKLKDYENDFNSREKLNSNDRIRSLVGESRKAKLLDDARANKKSFREKEKSPEKIISNRDSDDFSPPRKSKKRSPKSDDDFSPQRKGKFESKALPHTSKESRIQNRPDEDFSPKRKTAHNSDSDYSPPRRNEKIRYERNSRWNKPEKYSKSPRRSRSKDLSPRRYSKERYNDQNRYSRKYRSHRSSPERSHRSRNERYSSDVSPKQARDNSSRKYNSETREDFSPPRRSKIDDREQRQSFSKREKEKSRPERTLDGKVAGLQNAKLLREETERLRKKEHDMFKQLPTELSGKNADIVVRNRHAKTASELHREAEKDRERSKKDKEKQDVYSRWGMGLKQIEDYKTKIAEEMHESNKPLARYSDDADLDEMLKKQERQGDPMLQYIREKRQEHNKNSNIPTIPIYKGPFPENRFNIRPGYRWDGVDRSTGYEKKWFEMQNQKKAIQEEAYKYSVEDM